MKRKVLLFATLLSAMIFSGCIDTDITVDIDNKGNAMIYSDVLIKDSVFQNLSKEDMDKLKAKYDKIEKITSKGKSGYRITEKVRKINSIKDNDLSKIKGIEEFKGLIDIKKDKSIFYDTYDVKFNIKDYILEGNKTEGDKSVLSAIENSSNIKFHLKSPIKLLESNSTSESKESDKYIYNWTYTSNEMDNIYIKTKVCNIKNIIFVSLLSLIVIGMIVFFIVKKRTRVD